MAPEFREAFRTHLQKMFEDGRPQTCELRLLRHDGTHIDVLMGSSPHADSKRAQHANVIPPSPTSRFAERGEEAISRLAAIVESSNDAIIAKSLDGVITSWNQGGERIYGYSAQEVLGQPISILSPADRQDEVPEFLQKIGGGELIDHFETERLKKDGHLIQVSLTLSPIKDKTGRIVGASPIARDITQRKQAEEALRESEEKFKAIIYNARDGILVVDTESKRVFLANEMIGKMLGYGQDELKSLGVEDIHTQQDLPFVMEQFEKLQKGALSLSESIPVVRKDGSIFYAEINSFSITIAGKEYAAGFFRDIAERKQAEESIQEGYRKTQRALEETVSALSFTVETRDPYTAGHQKQVAQLACAIAREMGLPEDQIRALGISALLHDIGKMSVPAEILSRPGKISAMEFDIIKAHPEAGYNIVKRIHFPCAVAEAVIQHHERLDGSGYPKGLSGPEIVLEARILAVADVVEAMSSHRPYRPALGIDAALEEITKNKGVLYDPQVVEACRKILLEKGFTLE